MFMAEDCKSGKLLVVHFLNVFKVEYKVIVFLLLHKVMKFDDFKELGSENAVKVQIIKYFFVYWERMKETTKGS